MDCEQTFDRMYRYLDGEMTVFRRWTITRHLNRCPPCAQGFDFEMEVRQIVSSRCRDQMPAELKRKIADCLGIDLHENEK
jgi:mycothiol system anti-sigma-R factor